MRVLQTEGFACSLPLDGNECIADGVTTSTDSPFGSGRRAIRKAPKTNLTRNETAQRSSHARQRDLD